MRKILILTLALIFGATHQIFADNDKVIAVNQLPAAAQELIKTHFSNEKVALAKVDNDIIEKTYEVVFVSGTKIEFNGNGEWKEIDCRNSKMPESLVPAAIKAKVEEIYPGNYVVGIDKDRRSFDVKISNRLELKFDSKYNLLDIDD